MTTARGRSGALTEAQTAALREAVGPRRYVQGTSLSIGDGRIVADTRVEKALIRLGYARGTDGYPFRGSSVWITPAGRAALQAHDARASKAKRTRDPFPHLTALARERRRPFPLARRSDRSLRQELERLAAEFEKRGDHGGSPGEGIWEQMNEIETELRRRRDARASTARGQKGGEGDG